MPPSARSGSADWKIAVAALTGTAAVPDAGSPGASAEASAAPESPRTSMGLLFELREQTPRSTERWRGATAVRATATRSRTSAVRLGVRPVVQSDSGKWVKSTITWSNVGYQLNRLNLNQEQHRWFCQFVPLHRVDRPVYNGQDTEWLYLDEFESPLLWHLLAEAGRLGIAFTGSHRDALITVGRTATVALDAALTASALTLAPRLDIDGETHPVVDAGTLGSHGVYAFRLGAEPAIVLAPTAEPLSADQRRLLGAVSPGSTGLIVPAGEVDEFLTAYYPALRRGVPVTSTDASIEFPPAPPPVLVHTVSFEPQQAVRLDWQWEGERDEAAEGDLLHRVTTAIPDLAAPEPGSGPVTLTGLPAAEYADKSLPRLDDIDGVSVRVRGDRPDYRELTGTPHLTVTTLETEKRDWFDLGVLVHIDGRSVPFNPIFTALATGKKKLLLSDHSYLSLTQPVFDRLRDLIEEARALQEWETGLRINRHQASLWSDFEDLADETDQAVSWRAAVGGLLDLERGAAALPRSTPLPAGLNATLRPYQVAGFEWLVFLWEHGLGGILADDMGLGKTLQVLALLSHAVQHPAAPEDAVPESAEPRRPFLVVAPTSVVSNWVAEAARFTPGLRVGSVASTQATSGRALADQAGDVDVLVTSYALFRLDFDAYQALGWAGLILDEAQFVKNRTSQLYRSAQYIDVPFTLAVTGTPMENNLLELWALFSIVAPGLFPSARRFTEEYLRPAERKVRSQQELVEKLRRRIRPLMLRRTKDVVARDLPDKQEQVLRIDLSPEHREIYDTFLQRERQKLLGLMDDLEANRFIVFRSITLLRMLSLDASLVDDEYAGVASSKLDALLEKLDEVVAEGHRALIFSQFTSYLALAAARLEERGIPYSYLDGSTTDRPAVIDAFKTGDDPVFLISLKAGGFGLNLTEADYVFLLDPWWNPASESQAIDRTHRIGQTRNVMVYRLVAADTIEEKVMALKETKAQLTQAVLDDDALFAATLTVADLHNLLQ